MYQYRVARHPIFEEFFRFLNLRSPFKIVQTLSNSHGNSKY